MAISLKKGGNINLTNTDPLLKNIKIGLELGCENNRRRNIRSGCFSSNGKSGRTSAIR